MRIVEGQTKRQSVKIDLQVGKLTVYHISEAKLRLFRDGGTMIGRMNDWAYTFFTCSVSFLVAWITTDVVVAKYVLATLTFVCLIISVVLFFMKRNRKTELSKLYDEIKLGDL